MVVAEDLTAVSGDASAMLVVGVGKAWCAFPCSDVVETMRPLPIRALTNAPTFVSGVAVVRGEPVPVVDLEKLVSNGGSGETHRFVSLRVRAGAPAALVVAVRSVLGVRELPCADLRALPPLTRALPEAAIVTIGALDGEVLLLLDAARILPASLLARAANGD